MSKPQKSSLVMGVLNVTPDSFSDGGLHQSKESAIRHVAEMVVAGADIIDIGGESTRPGAKEVPLQEELNSTIPMVESFPPLSITLSIDTRKSEVAKCAVAPPGRQLSMTPAVEAIPAWLGARGKGRDYDHSDAHAGHARDDAREPPPTRAEWRQRSPTTWRAA